MVAGVLFLIVGIVLLTFAADHFVEGAARIASGLNLSPVVVGALVIGFGTSLPEMLVSGVAAVQGDSELGVGNVIGSNVANLTLVLGLAALITVIAANAETLRSELPLCVGSVLLFAVFVQNGFEVWEGVVLLVALVVALGWLLRFGGDNHLDDNFGPGEEADADTPVVQEAVRTVLGLIGTVAGAWLLVDGALAVADGLGLSGGFVGLTLVAIGTSLPEMVTAVVAARKGETGLIIGNLLGSNIFNSLAVGAVLGLLGPGPLDDSNLAGLATVIMIAVVVIAAAFLLSGGAVVRWQAVVLLLIYFVSMPFTASTTVDCDESPADASCVDSAAEAAAYGSTQ